MISKHYRGVTMMLEWCYSDITVILQWFYSGITVMLQVRPQSVFPWSSFRSSYCPAAKQQRPAEQVCLEELGGTELVQAYSSLEMLT